MERTDFEDPRKANFVPLKIEQNNIFEYLMIWSPRDSTEPPLAKPLYYRRRGLSL
jgi:hypothetical protein